MGAVYAVTDQDGTRYALKVLLDATDVTHTKRFLREATASAQIDSPHVAKVHDSGVLDDGSPFILMELLHGEDLADLVGARGPLPADEAIQLLLPVLDVLEQAHGKGMVHRDIKPANVFNATLPDGTRCVKLLDFGISKPALTGVAPMTQLTQTGTVLGSPDYMAPEQLVSSSDVDARTDIWAIGVTLHELLTGQGAFGGTTLAELITAIMRDAPRPSDKRVRTCIPSSRRS